MDKSLHVVYPRNSRAFMLHILHKRKLTAAMNSCYQWQSLKDSEYHQRYLCPCPSIAEHDHHEGSSRKVLWLELWQRFQASCWVSMKINQSNFLRNASKHRSSASSSNMACGVIASSARTLEHAHVATTWHTSLNTPEMSHSCSKRYEKVMQHCTAAYITKLIYVKN